MFSRAIALVQVVVATCVTSCIDPRSGYKELHFELPTDFQGAFVVVLDPSGQDLNSKNKVVSIDIPSSGMVKLRSFEIFREPRRRFCMYRDGRSIITTADARSSEVALRGGGEIRRLNKPTIVVFFLGTEDAFDKFDLERWYSEHQEELSH